MALVIDFDGLLRRRRMVAWWGRLQHEPVYGGEDEQLADQPRHCGSGHAQSRHSRVLWKGLLAQWS
jgi:hypothetical protein